MKLLFVTHKVHEHDDEYSFTILWAHEFARQGFEVIVVCLEKGEYTGDLTVLSLGKEEGLSHVASLMRFWKIILTTPYDRVFIHMNPKWTVAGALYWWMKRIPVYLWYTHYTMHLPLRVSHWLCKRLFAATKESMPQYDGDPKKVITGHGVDTRFWDMPLPPRERRKPKTELLSVHRICRSKRLDLVIRALARLPEAYTLTHYGPTFEKDYKAELDLLVTELGLTQRVHFRGSVPMMQLRDIYPKYNCMVNMASATIDKTMVEGMLAGVHPVVSRDNAIAIGFNHAPEADTPEALAQHIKQLELSSIETLVTVAKEKHSLEHLVQKMSEYIQAGR